MVRESRDKQNSKIVKGLGKEVISASSDLRDKLDSMERVNKLQEPKIKRQLYGLIETIVRKFGLDLGGPVTRRVKKKIQKEEQAKATGKGRQSKKKVTQGTTQPKRKPGRPPGSKNKPKVKEQDQVFETNKETETERRGQVTVLTNKTFPMTKAMDIREGMQVRLLNQVVEVQEVTADEDLVVLKLVDKVNNHTFEIKQPPTQLIAAAPAPASTQQEQANGDESAVANG